MLFGIPTTPGGWSLMILSLRLIHIDIRELDALYKRERLRFHQPKNSTLTPLALRLTLDFIGLFLAFDSFVGGVGGIILGIVVSASLFKRVGEEPRSNPAMAVALSRRLSNRRWSQEFKNLLRRDDGIAETGLEENHEITDRPDAASGRSSGDLPSDDAPPRPQSRLSKHILPHGNRVKFHDFFDFKPSASPPSPASLSTNSDDDFDLDLDLDDFRPDFDHLVELPMLEVLELQVDDWVQLQDGQQGIIRFLGGRISSATEWIGVEVIPDIAVNGAIAADWPSEAGVYVRPSAVERIIHRPQMDQTKVSMHQKPIEDDERPFWGWRRSTQSVYTLGTLASIREIPEDDSEEDSGLAESTLATPEEQEAASGDLDARSILDKRGQDGEDENNDHETSPQIWTKSSDATLNASELCSSSSTIGSAAGAQDALYEDFAYLRKAETFDFEAGIFSRRTSSEADEEHDLCHGSSSCIEDTDEFEARLEMLVSDLDDILAATKRDLERGGMILGSKQDRAGNNAGSAQAPVVKDTCRRSFDINGTVGLPSKLRRRWKEWTKGVGSSVAFDLVSGVRTG